MADSDTEIIATIFPLFSFQQISFYKLCNKIILKTLAKRQFYVFIQNDKIYHNALYIRNIDNIGLVDTGKLRIGQLFNDFLQTDSRHEFSTCTMKHRIIFHAFYVANIFESDFYKLSVGSDVNKIVCYFVRYFVRFDRCILKITMNNLPLHLIIWKKSLKIV